MLLVVSYYTTAYMLPHYYMLTTTVYSEWHYML